MTKPNKCQVPECGAGECYEGAMWADEVGAKSFRCYIHDADKDHCTNGHRMTEQLSEDMGTKQKPTPEPECCCSIGTSWNHPEDCLIHNPALTPEPVGEDIRCSHGYTSNAEGLFYCEACSKETGMIHRLLKACDGHPYAKIPWPHRILHEAVEQIQILRGDRDKIYKTAMTYLEQRGESWKKIRALQAEINNNRMREKMDLSFEDTAKQYKEDWELAEAERDAAILEVGKYARLYGLEQAKNDTANEKLAKVAEAAKMHGFTCNNTREPAWHCQFCFHSNIRTENYHNEGCPLSTIEPKEKP